VADISGVCVFEIDDARRGADGAGAGGVGGGVQQQGQDEEERATEGRGSKGEGEAGKKQQAICISGVGMDIWKIAPVGEEEAEGS
jgi:hypothetical protein